ncbi:hypothetical protein E5D57_005917 [Metarhizium anisopliae]|nr:hypothetical protein E5D57_005917 [Metarhizium anisopliae]
MPLTPSTKSTDAVPLILSLPLALVYQPARSNADRRSTKFVPTVPSKGSTIPPISGVFIMLELSPYPVRLSPSWSTRHTPPFNWIAVLVSGSNLPESTAHAFAHPEELKA